MTIRALTTYAQSLGLQLTLRHPPLPLWHVAGPDCDKGFNAPGELIAYLVGQAAKREQKGTAA